MAQQVAWAFGLNSAEDLIESLEGGGDDSVAEDPGDLEGWSSSKMNKYVFRLKPTARKVLRAIAEGAPETTVEHVQASTGLEPAAFAGSMSSFGFAVNNTRGVQTKPFSKSGQTYSMSLPLANLVIQTLDDAGL